MIQQTYMTPWRITTSTSAAVSTMRASWRRWAAACAAICAVSACGSTSASGEWCGRSVATAAECRGDEVFFAKLTQVDDTVTGQICEAYEKDCSPVTSGLVTDNQLALAWGTSSFTATATLTVIEGASLSGAGTSCKTAADCRPFQVTLFPIGAP
jgi:hypothetical protein